MDTWRRRILEVSTLLGGLAVLAQIAPPARRTTARVWRNLYPQWTTAALVVVALLLAIWLLRTQRALTRARTEVSDLKRTAAEAEQALAATAGLDDERRAERDRQVLDAIRAQLPRSAIEWVRQFDFGGSWSWEQTEPFLDIEDRLVPIEVRFASPDLEEFRKRLFEAVEQFGQRLAVDSGSAAGKSNRYNVMDRRDFLMDPEAERIWAERKDRLNARADQVAEAYDALILAAQDRGLY